MDLTATQQKFILHWGEMGSKWGINRTVAQIHALLFVSAEPLNAEQIAGALSVARSNVSNSLRELQGWGILKTVHQLGDRREYYTTLDDVWVMYRLVMDERKKREIDPTIALLRQCIAESKSGKSPGPGSDTYTHRRLSDMLSFIETMSTWYQQVSRLPPRAFTSMAKAGSKLMQLFGAGKPGKNPAPRD